MWTDLELIEAPATPTEVDRGYEKLRIDMENLFDHLGIWPRPQVAATA